MSIKWDKRQKINIHVDFLPRSLLRKLHRNYSVFAIHGEEEKK